MSYVYAVYTRILAYSASRSFEGRGAWWRGVVGAYTAGCAAPPSPRQARNAPLRCPEGCSPRPN